MNTLELLRQDLVETLNAAGLRGLAQIKGRFEPPVAFVIPAAPYLTQGPQFGHFTVSFTAVLVAPTRASEITTTELDQMIVDAVIALTNSAKWQVGDVSDPASLSLAGGEYLGALIGVSTSTVLEDGR